MRVPRRRRGGGVEFGGMETTSACGCARGESFMPTACGRAACVVAATARWGGEGWRLEEEDGRVVGGEYAWGSGGVCVLTTVDLAGDGCCC